MELEKLVYICHEFGGTKENFDRVDTLMKILSAAYPNICFLSPVHALSFLKYDKEDLSHCLFMLDMCDEMWTFGEKSMSPGCLGEKAYCKEHRIPIYDWQVG